MPPTVKRPGAVLPVATLLAAHPYLKPVRDKYGADYAALALEQREGSELYESQCLGGDMGVRSVFLSPAGEAIHDAAEHQALNIFDCVMQDYFAVAAGFDRQGPYRNAAEHAGNEYNPGHAPAQIDAYERLNNAHWSQIEPCPSGVS